MITEWIRIPVYAPIRWTTRERERENVCNRAKLCQASEIQVNKNNLKNKQKNKKNQLVMLSVYIYFIPSSRSSDGLDIK
jgi:hypothetical protein